VDTSEEHHNGQIIPGSCLGYSHLAAQLRDHERDIQDSRMRREKQEQEERARKLQVEKCRLLVQRIYAKFVHARDTLRQQLQDSRVREQELHANLLAIEQERDKFKALVSTLEASDKKWRGIATATGARCLEARMTAFKLRAGLRAAKFRTRNVQEQLETQTRLASGKDPVIQSITEESHALYAKLKDAEHEIARLDAELQQERERSKVLIFTLEASDKKRREWEERTAAADGRCSDAKTTAFNLRADLATAMAQARVVEEQLDRQTKLASGKDLVIQSITEESQVLHTKLKDEIARLDAELRRERDRGQLPLPPEQILGLGPPVLSAFDPNSPPIYSPSSSPCLPLPDRGGPSSRQTARLYRTSAPFDQASDVAKSQQAALQELLERMLQLESESAQLVNSGKHDEKRLQGKLAGTKEQLRLAEEELLHVRRDLKRSRETLREVETRARDVTHELDMCRVKMREGQDTRRSLRFKLDEAAELLRLRSAELDSSKIEAETSQFKCSQITFLSVALQERVTELEAELKMLKSTPKHSALSSAHDDTSGATDTGGCASQFAPTHPLIPSGFETITNNADLHVSDSIYMTVPPSLPCLLDLSLPPSSSQYSDSSLYFSHQKFSAMTPTCVDSRLVLPENMGMNSTLWL